MPQMFSAHADSSGSNMPDISPQTRPTQELGAEFVYRAILASLGIIEHPFNVSEQERYTVPLSNYLSAGCTGI